MRRKLLDLHASLERLADIVAKLVPGVSFVFSFIAFREFMANADQPPAVTALVAALAAAACAGILYFLYAAILGGIPAVARLECRKFLGLLAFLMLKVSMFSTYPHVVVTAGPEAIRLHQATMLDALLSTRTAIQDVAGSIGELGPSLGERKARLEAAAACEIATGCRSGTPKRGDLSDALTSAAGKVGAAEATILASETTMAKLMPQLDAAFARGDDIAVRNLLTQMRGTIPFGVMTATAADLRVDLGIKGTAKNAALRARQDEAIAGVQRELGEIGTMLDGAAERIGSRLNAIAMPERQSITKARAIIMYAPSLIPQIALGIAIDWVLIVGAFLMAMLRDATPPEDDDVSDLSLADLKRGHRELMKLLREVSASGPQDPPAATPPVKRGRKRRLDANVVPLFPEPAQ